jgi:U3 small nucleolar RNA-associated protein 13
MDRTLKRWNLPGSVELDARSETDQEELSLTAFLSVRAHEKDINIVSVAPNDSLIASGSQDKTVKLWKSTDLSLLATLKGHRRGVWDCQFSPFDRVLATASVDKTVKLWSLGDFSCVRSFQGHVASVLRVRFLSGGMQLISSGTDGLVKLWTVRTNECVATMDSHTGKVWALDMAQSGNLLVSGGADSRIIVWEDTTKEVEEARKAEEEENILADQRLANHLRHKEYAEALNISLDRDKPLQTLKVLTAVMEADLEKGESGLVSFKKYAKVWPFDRIVQVLRYCREWNTRSRNSHVALLIIKAIVSTVPAHKLAATEGVPEILAGIIPYAERHFDRLDRLHSSSYLLDFALSSMGVMDSQDDGDDFAAWESTTRLVLPPKQVDGRIDVGGRVVVGASIAVEGSDEDDEVMTLGESDSSEEEEEAH